MIGFIRKATKKQKIFSGGIAALAVVLGIFFLTAGNGTFKNTILVKKGTLTQIVSVTGKTQAVTSAELSFEKTGRVASIPVEVGDKVTRGQTLAALDSSELKAQLNDALANIDVQRAKLDEILVGSRPEDIKIKEAELAKDEQDLANYYGSVLNISNDAYNKADDSLRKQLDQFFNNDEEQNPSLTFDLSNSQLKTDIENRRFILGLELKDWSTKLSNASFNSGRGAQDALLLLGQAYLGKLQIFLGDVFQVLVSSVSLSESTVTTYKANVDTARSSVNTAVSSITDLIQNISAQKIVVQKAKYQLELERAGSTKEQIAAQEAQLKQAEAKAQVIQTQISHSIIFAPFSGLVAKQDMEVGEVVAANETLITLISDDSLEVEANVPEVNIGKVGVGNPAEIKLDAFSDEVFDGRVIYVEPAETLIEGVVNYKIKVLFDKPDKRVRSGLTADIDVFTLVKENVLKIPGYTLRELPDGSFTVDLKSGRKFESVPIEIGSRGSDGEVEILSGLSEGDEVAANLE